MRLTQFSYKERVGTNGEWVLAPFSLGKVTLLVGQNGAGKSRTLAVIGALARTLFSGVLADGEFTAEFDSGLRYHLDVSGRAIAKEELTLNNDVLLDRKADGTGWLRGSEVPRLSFGLAPGQLAAFAKRDTVQHEYLEPLFDWANQLRTYRFGDHMGRTNLIVIAPEFPKPDLRDTDQVVALFEIARRKNSGFGRAVAEDMTKVGYDVEDVFLGEIPVVIGQSLPGPVMGLQVKERDLPGPTRQLEMSQGMFRALAILVHLNYALEVGTGGTIVLDDIGEGLDYERSTSLINLLVDKLTNLNAQLIMSTNDRYVMDAVPLEYWAIIVRERTECRILNYENSKTIFDEFLHTGLSNVDFLRMQYWANREEG